jgi:TATA-binding protein-associated factor Taf7
MRPRRYRKRASNTQLDRTVRTVDKLAEMEDLYESLAPALRQDLTAGMSSEEILAKYESLAAARVITALRTDQGLQAAKDILDRRMGKAVERKELNHRLATLSDEQVDALLKSRMQDVVGGGDEE